MDFTKLLAQSDKLVFCSWPELSFPLIVDQYLFVENTDDSIPFA